MSSEEKISSSMKMINDNFVDMAQISDKLLFNIKNNISAIEANYNVYKNISQNSKMNKFQKR